MKRKIALVGICVCMLNFAFLIDYICAQPVQWKILDGGNGHYYDIVLFSNGITWTQAKLDAENRGGYLATILSAAENEFIFLNLVNDPTYWLTGSPPWQNQAFGPWIGGFQPPGSIEPAGGWKWLNNDGDFVYSNWLSGEPNNFEPGEGVVLFYDNNLEDPAVVTDKWNDWPRNNKTISYVLEFNELPFPEIDIKPGSYPNSINYKNEGLIPVAVLSFIGFYPTTDLDVASLKFGATGNESSLAFCSAAEYDFNMDGAMDLICHFYTPQSGFECGDTEGILKGKLINGTDIIGRDSVKIVPCMK